MTATEHDGITFETPLFMTPNIVKESMDHVINAMMAKDSIFGDNLRREGFHAVLYAPCRISVTGENPLGIGALINRIEYGIVGEKSYLGHPDSWPRRFDNIARSKSSLLVGDRHDGRTDSMPHLLLPGDTAYWGGKKREGLVCSCSGEKPYFDRMAAGMIIDMSVARANHAFRLAQEAGEFEDFV